MRDIEELRAIANKRNQTLETLLYEMLVDAMAENQKYKEAFDKVKRETEEKIDFCSNEAEGYIHHEKCDKTTLFLKELLDILKEVE